MTFNRKNHWQTIYDTKPVDEVSWYEPTPTTSLKYIEGFQLSKAAHIIDIGGGDSFLVDHLLALGYQNITVLDISENAINRAKQRLANQAQHVTWIVADAASFKPTQKYDVWHDRAAFHFLTNQTEINAYIDTIHTGLTTGGKLVLGTFSEDGPKKCSGIDITQYSISAMKTLLNERFSALECKNVDHPTPFDTVQRFTFCSFESN